MKKIAALLFIPILASITSCTPREVELWKAWHARDPIAADRFAHNLSPAPSTQTHWTVDWNKVAWCESGGQWHHTPVRGYSGGLMIREIWWDANGGERYADAAWQATKDQQIAIAERIVTANGGGYAGADRGWQCVP